MFLGTFPMRLDEKHRLILPAKYRPELAEGLVMTRGQERCVYVFPGPTFERIVGDLSTAPLSNRAARDYARMLLSGAQDEVPDKQGRVTVSPLLRSYAGLAREVSVLGVGSRLEIWDADMWAEQQAGAEQPFAERDTEILPGVL